MEKKLTTAIEEAKILGKFKSFCEKNENPSSQNRLRNIISRTQNKENTIKSIFINEMKMELTDEQAERMLELVVAFLKKSNFRKPIPASVKTELLRKQNYKCNFCDCKINLSDHADHIVPFKYVGDELQNNLQMLCSHCNKSKSSNIDYEIKMLLRY